MLSFVEHVENVVNTICVSVEKRVLAMENATHFNEESLPNIVSANCPRLSLGFLRICRVGAEDPRHSPKIP